jgi:hypothetical protein
VPTFVDSNNASGTTDEEATVTKPTGTANGHGLELAISFNRNGGGTAGVTWTPSQSGWTQIDRQDNATASAVGLVTYRRIASSDPASYGFTPDQFVDYIMEVVAYSGVDAAWIDGASAHSSQQNAEGTNVAAASIDTATADTKLVWAGAGGRNASPHVLTFTQPGGMTLRERVDLSGIYIWNNALCMADEDRAATGATGTRTGTVNNATDAGNMGMSSAI